MPDTAERGNRIMAIFHFTVKIVGRSKGKSVISASAYLNGDVMKNEETGRISYYTSKKEVVYTSLMMCENAPPEWLHVPEENIKRFQQSIRYKRADDKDAALEKFKITFQKQRLWNEVLKIEKNADAQLGRSFEFSLPKEWSRQEQIDYTTEYIQKTFVDKGMCVDWSIHDKGDGNPHVHLLVTMRPFNLDHSWGSKEVKDWDFARDTDGNIVVDESHPDWWQDKKNPDRHGIRIPVLDENGVQKVGARNRKQWKRVLTDATGWNNPKNCELWRSEWAGMCNRHLSIDNQIDHRSYERQGKLKIPTIHEGADARKIEEKYLTGQIWNGSWKVEENQMIKKQNALLQKVITTFGKVSGALSIWKEWLNDIRRKQRSNSHDGSNDYTDRGTAEYHGRDASGNTGKGREADVLSGAGRTIAAIRERIIRTASNLAGYRRTVDTSGRKDRPDTEAYRRKSAMAGIGTEIKQREPAIAETEQRITELEQQLEKGRSIDERIKKLKERRSTGRVASADRADAGRTRPERQGKLKVPMIHEGADARKIDEKYLTGQIRKGSWKVEENRMIKKQNALLQKVIATFGKVSGALSMWRECLNDIRRKQRSNSHDGSNDYTDRGTTEYHGRDASGDTGKGREADVLSGAGRTIAAIRERIIRAASNLAGYRRTADASGRKGRPDTATYRRESAMAGISTEIKQREPIITETEQRITDIEQQIEKARDIDDRIRKLKERRSTGRTANADRADAGRTRPERPDYREIENADRRIADLEREVKQREQSREHSSLKERLEENKRIIAERERENARCRNHDRGMSR